jgi:RNA polymerase sigma-70 factor (ECF subfamily)
MSDTALLAGFLGGDERCFTEIMNRYRDRVYRLSMRYLKGDQAAAKDVTQQAFLKLFTDGHTFRGEGTLKSWIFTTAVNLSISELRRRARFSGTPVEDQLDAGRSRHEGTEIDGMLDYSKQSAFLKEMVAMLPEKQKLVLTLRVDADLPFEDVARAAGMSVNSAKVNYHHAVVALRRKMTGDKGIPGNG